MKTIHHQHTTEGGFSLIGVIVAIGLVSVLMMVMMQVLSNGFKQELVLKQILEAREIATELQEIAKSVNCGIIDLVDPIPVTDPNWAPATKYEMKLGLQGRFSKYVTGNEYGALKIQAMAISPYQTRDPMQPAQYFAMDEGLDPSDLADAKLLKGSLRVELTADGLNKNQETTKAPLLIPIFIGLSADQKNIVSCRADIESDNFKAFCESVNGDWDEAAGKCNLPCPQGMVRESNLCVPSEEISGGKICLPNDDCDATNAYIWN